jgi:hypothetical protein
MIELLYLIKDDIGLDILSIFSILKSRSVNIPEDRMNRIQSMLRCVLVDKVDAHRRGNVISLEAIDDDPLPLDLDGADLFSPNDAIAILQIIRSYGEDAAIRIRKVDLYNVIVLVVVRVGSVDLIEFATLVESVASIRLLLERDRKCRKRCILLEGIEENAILLDSDSCDERSIHDAVSVADIVRRQIDRLAS